MVQRKTKAANDFQKSKVKINHLLVMNYLKLHCRIKKELNSLVQTVHVSSKKIQE